MLKYIHFDTKCYSKVNETFQVPIFVRKRVHAEVKDFSHGTRNGIFPASVVNYFRSIEPWLRYFCPIRLDWYPGTKTISLPDLQLATRTTCGPMGLYGKYTKS
ncbi:hypothetical protein E2C01_062066 [Portunus trituberculatus]|uniref:Uncharacterized protein n=1 Tax=Portunus trituberculatus TaxID=210409 RepID=A0A5B7H6Y1_PORTR|nr:hypothetical protein [Portunus trituberculatus]